ncbi:MAG: glycosyltransferase [Candidatus Competibacteraceae bacterium]
MKKVAFFLYSLSGGGTERVNLSLANELSEMGYLVDLVLVNKSGEFLNKVREDIRIIDFQKFRAIECIYRLAQYLRRERPTVLFTALPTLNIIGISANIIAGFKTNVIPTEHMPVSIDERETHKIEPKIAYKLYPLFYKFVKNIVVNCEDSAKDFTKRYKWINKKKIKIIYNPVVSNELLEMAQETPEIDWFKEPIINPIILGVGRLTKQKNFHLLVEAFAKLRAKYNCRLVILGNGEDYGSLKDLAKNLGIEKDFLMPGFKENPYSYMTRASVFVLSSIYETLPTVLIEALACGTPVVATDCFGVREILQNGEYGIIVNNPTAVEIAFTIKEVLDSNSDKARLIERAKFFGIQEAAKKYSMLIEEVTS